MVDNHVKPSRPNAIEVKEAIKRIKWGKQNVQITIIRHCPMPRIFSNAFLAAVFRKSFKWQRIKLSCLRTLALLKQYMLSYRNTMRSSPLDITYLHLEKAFNRMPHELIWCTLRQHRALEELLRWVKLLYYDPNSKVHRFTCVSKPLCVSVDVH